MYLCCVCQERVGKIFETIVGRDCQPMCKLAGLKREDSALGCLGRAGLETAGNGGRRSANLRTGIQLRAVGKCQH